MDGNRSDQKNGQLLEELLLEGLATPAEELSAEYLEQLRRDVREVITKARAKHVQCRKLDR
jgi:septum formation topological specificity factor MinE